MELYSEADRPDESLQRLVLPCRLLGEALAQDDQFLSLEETCAAGAGSADYDFRLPQFLSEHLAEDFSNKKLQYFFF